MERRTSKRTTVDLYLNKYIEGYPYTCRAVDISHGGILLECLNEPVHDRKFYPIELGVPGVADRIWVWTRSVWTHGRTQALRFVAMDALDELLLEQFIESQGAAA